MKRIDRAIAIIVSDRGDMSFPETEKELQQLVDHYKTLCACIVFRKDRMHEYKPRPTDRAAYLDLP